MCNDYAEYDELLSRYFDGAATPQDLARLEADLLRGDRLADYVSQWSLMHRQVVELLREDALCHLMDQFPAGAPSLPKSVYSPLAGDAPHGDHQAAPLPPARNPRPAGRILLGFAAVAATLLAGVGLLWHQRGEKLRSAAGQPLASSAGPVGSAVPDGVVATVTRLSGASWQADAKPLKHGDQLAAGDRIALAAGLAKVTYDCGAEVVLQGPCEFVVQSKMVGVLRSGKITADVPRRAFAFAILAPGVDFVDLGTSFGLNVNGQGAAELHVFDGEVLCNQTGEAQAGEGPIHVTADNAKGFAANGDLPADIAIDKQQFAGHIELRKGQGVQPQPWTGDELALWLAADASVSTDDQGRVMAWRDLVYADNRSAEDAIQADRSARPALAPNGVNGRPAVRFDGSSDFLLTTPLQTTDDQTVLFVCQFAPSAFGKQRRWGGQIINYDGPPSRYLSDTLEPGVLQIGEPLLEGQFRPSLLTGQVFAGFVGSTTVEAGRIDGAPAGAQRPVVVSYVYDYSGGRAELQINGRSFGEARAFAPQAITSRKIIGRHAWMQNFFHGDVAELMIYNKTLSPPEIAEVTRYLADKYNISLEQPASLDQAAGASQSAGSP
ncbi:MAG TPA: LamG-like jellyroll fold domain-containing protein [Lacipirellulaceae bacterium]|nr:LamG-like jellyroll fold domain-containing protein [Lacipirellulaceae bacterium]